MSMSSSPPSLQGFLLSHSAKVDLYGLPFQGAGQKSQTDPCLTASPFVHIIFLGSDPTLFCCGPPLLRGIRIFSVKFSLNTVVVSAYLPGGSTGSWYTFPWLFYTERTNQRTVIKLCLGGMEREKERENSDKGQHKVERPTEQLWVSFVGR